MDIVGNPDGTLVVPVQPPRRHDADDGPDVDVPHDDVPTDAVPTTRLLHPGEGG